LFAAEKLACYFSRFLFTAYWNYSHAPSWGLKGRENTRRSVWSHYKKLPIISLKSWKTGSARKLLYQKHC